MDILLEYNSKKLKAYVKKKEKSKACILFLSGGSIKIGKERYKEWQDNLYETGISSLSFDYSGVNGSGSILEQSSLHSRIDEAVYVSDWLTENIHSNVYILYGVSMGGYIALGLVNKKPNMFEKLILHAPAAYSQSVQDIPFSKKFTHEIKIEDSWTSSLSFDWLQMYKNSTLLIEAENDEIIPPKIIKKYKEVCNPEILLLKEARHDIWNNTLKNTIYRKNIYLELKKLINLNL